MTARRPRPDPADPWAPWEPSAAEPWSMKWAGHLFRRAAFGASWPELRDALRDGPAAAVDRLLAGGEGADEYDRVMDALAPDGGPYPGRPTEDVSLASWWLHRMVRTPHPLRERMTLFWHDHFATSILKVRRADLMARQNILLRKHALGKFGPLLMEVGRDPAMLIWLDSDGNVKGRPNENFARELMELFTLGVGHYTESDVKEAARAFTGWHAVGTDSAYDPVRHDDGEKTVLGRSGRLSGDDVCRIVLDEPATARHLARKVYRAFVGEDRPDDDLITPLADRYRASGYDAADLIGTVLRSRIFYSERAFRRRIKGPAEYVVGLLRALEAKPSDPQAVGMGASRHSLAVLMDGLGQDLFAPPNVKGWPGGESWLNSATILARHNVAWSILRDRPAAHGVRVGPAALARKYAGRRDPEAQVDFFLDLLLQPGEGGAAFDAPRRRKLADFLATPGAPPDDGVREVVHAILLVPEYQLA